MKLFNFFYRVMEQRVEYILPGIVLACLFLLALALASTVAIENQHFLYLAESFSLGRLDLLAESGRALVYSDVSILEGRIYLPFGPAPAVMLIPAYLILRGWSGVFFVQPFLIYGVQMITAIVIYKTIRTFAVSRHVGLWLTIVFLVGTPYTQVFFYPLNSWITHAFTTLFLFASLYEYQTHRRWWLIGLLLGFAAATRITVGLGIIFYALLLLEKRGLRQKVSEYITRIRQHVSPLWQLLVPFAIIFSLLFVYNFFRFGEFLEAGYNFQLIDGVLVEWRLHGLFSFDNVVRNLFYFFLAPPQIILGAAGTFEFPYVRTNGWGTSMVLVVPYLLWLFKANYADLFPRAAIFTSFIMFIVLMSFFASGYYQFGYRYALDFLPLLFMAFVYFVGKKVIRFTPALLLALIWSVFFGAYMGIFGTVIWYN